MRKALLMTLLLLALATAGCIGGGDDKEKTTGTVIDKGDPNTGEPPVGNATSSVLAELTLGQTNGTLPLAVTFHINATLPGANTTTDAMQWSWVLEVWTIPEGNGTELNFTEDTDAEYVESGFEIPGTAIITLSEGDYYGRLTVTYTDFDDGTSERIFSVVRDGPPPPSAPPVPHLFADAEGDAGWTVTGGFVATNANLCAGGATCQEQEVPGTGDWGHWITTDEQALSGSNSWFSEYPNLYRSRLTSIPIVIPDDGWTYSLSYAIMGDVESNSYDGIHIFVTPEGGEKKKIKAHDTEFADWTPVSVKLDEYSGQTITLEIMFQSDSTCDAVFWPAAGCGTGSGIGYYIDDIRIQ